MNKTNREIGIRIREEASSLAERVYAHQVDHMPELKEQTAKEFAEKSIRDTKYNLLYLADAIMVTSPDLFCNYLKWLLKLMEGIGIPEKYIVENFVSIKAVLHERFKNEESLVIEEFINQGLDNVQDCYGDESEDYNPLSTEKDAYINALLQGDRKKAGVIVQDLVKRKIPLEDIYLSIFQQSQYEIGDLWQQNKITVAKEHYCTAATQLIMGQLYPMIFETPKRDLTFVATCVGQELHELGIRMVSDFLELSGWNTYYLGANLPTAEVIQTIIEEKPQVVGISATITYHISEVQRLIEEIRKTPGCEEVKIMAGGYPFLVDRSLWKTLGADGFARNAEEAVTVAESLIITSEIQE